MLTKSTGPLARIMPNTVVTDDIDLYRKINALKPNGYTKGAWYSAFKMDAVRENLFSERDETLHTRIRQRLAAGVSSDPFMYRSAT